MEVEVASVIPLAKIYGILTLSGRLELKEKKFMSIPVIQSIHSA